eukprot:gnl/TRDRNA2_/TRDRNA2_133888_c0_seq1.p1 gnl/TRDRNA2_/TRDRNA2_133888_c0~~gnl/TRDRNA2_/TRDRNA2_133888_c0_seq1.p1  ORF type:complete len:317 (-),score=39.37 gnl/TRDRNA2_/TRDRNA2_133888_c0_seq1:284-1126(-)
MWAVCFTHPADVMKVRLQLTGECNANKRSLTAKDFLRIGRKLALEEGVKSGLYAGITASWLRQAIFSSLRHGLYGVAERSWRQRNNGQISLPTRLTCAILSGCTASVIANPTDVTLIRMQSDGFWPEPQRRGYRHVFDGIYRIVRDEGVASLWRGCGPTVTRAALVTGSQITTYDEVKAAMLRLGYPDAFQVHLCSAISSATVACIVTSPVDVVKTRIMNMQRDHGISYKGPLDVVWKTLKTEGPLAFYKGLSATFLRLWPHTLLLWMAQERISGWLRDL